VQMNAEMNVQSIVLLQEVEKAFCSGYDVFILNTEKVYPLCCDQRIAMVDIADLEFVAYDNNKISTKMKYYARKILPFLKEEELDGLLVVENDDIIPDKIALSKVFKIHTADYQETVSVISLLNRRIDDIRSGKSKKTKKTENEMDEFAIAELYECASECLKKDGKIFINGKEYDYPRCKSKNVEFIQAEKVEKITNINTIRGRIREFFARHIYWSVVPSWEYVPPVVVFEASEAEGVSAMRRRSFYYYKANKKIISSVLKRL